MGQRRKFSEEYKREAVAMLESSGVSVSQIAAELGIGGECPRGNGVEPVMSSRVISRWNLKRIYWWR